MWRWAGAIFITWFGEYFFAYLRLCRSDGIGAHDSGLSILLSRLLALSYGVGAALTLDEFALWLNLDAMAYWSRQGRESIDAIVLFGALLSIGAWGAPLFRRLAQLRTKAGRN